MAPNTEYKSVSKLEENCLGEKSGSTNSEVSDDGETILNMILNNPKDYLGEKPGATRENAMFTLDSKVVPLESAKADDTGPDIYIYKGTNTKCCICRT